VNERSRGDAQQRAEERLGYQQQAKNLHEKREG
jgi:hypothetical protein